MADDKSPAKRGWSDRVLALGTLPVAATALTGTVAVYIALVAFGNITDFGTNRQFVQHVLAMDTTFKDDDLMWRAIESRTLQDAVYVAIIVWETLAALVLLAATWLWGQASRHVGNGGNGGNGGSAGNAYERPRRASTLGLVMLLSLFGLGFIGIGGEWFAMWQSSDWNGLDAALRNVVVAGLVLVVIHLPALRKPGEPVSP